MREEIKSKLEKWTATILQNIDGEMSRTLDPKRVRELTAALKNVVDLQKYVDDNL